MTTNPSDHRHERGRECFCLELPDKTQVGWDVDRLWELRDLAYPGTCLTVRKWRAFVDAHNLNPHIDDAFASMIDLDKPSRPVFVVYYVDKAGRLRFACADGNHRMRRAEMLGIGSLPALRFDAAIATKAILSETQVDMAINDLPWYKAPRPEFAATLVGRERPRVYRVEFVRIARNPLLLGSEINSFDADGNRIGELSGVVSESLSNALLAAVGPSTRWFPTKLPNYPGLAMGEHTPSPMKSQPKVVATPKADAGPLPPGAGLV